MTGEEKSPAMPPGPRDNSPIEETFFGQDDFPLRVVRRQGKSVTAHPLFTHLEMEIQFICQGQGHYFIRDRAYRFQKNSVLLIHRHEAHNSLAHPDSAVKRLSLVFSPRLLQGRPSGLAALDHLAQCHHVGLSEQDATTTEFLIQLMLDEGRTRRGPWQMLAVNCLENLLLVIDRAHHLKPPAPRRANPLVQQAIDYLEQHFAERVTLAEVADLVHCSPYSLSRSFKAYAGLGFKDYLIHRRISEAKRLLAGTPAKIIIIARRVGFDDLSTFNRDFKLLTGASPSAYRRMAAGDRGVGRDRM